MFDYTEIPEGFYDKIFDNKNGMRKFWHWHKFDSVNRFLENKNIQSILDIGCFAGSFLGRFYHHSETHCLGVDILPEQIAYANDRYKKDNVHFKPISNFDDIQTVKDKKTFDVVTFIEVIEHLTHEEIHNFFKNLILCTHENSEVIITTPNYFSLWPLLEYILDKVSDVKYEEQHITRFTYFNIERKLKAIFPDFDKYFIITKTTTTHLVTPYIAILNYDLAKRLSMKIHPTKWKFPFGGIILLSLKRK